MLVKHYVFCSSGSTFTLCALDISKAFERVDVYWLLNALMTRRFPKTYVCTAKMCGYSSMGNCLSMIFLIIAGVRQGGLLSAALFAIYIDDLIDYQKASKFGCCLNGVYYGCLVYADDVLLLSHSVQLMQNMLDICGSYPGDFDVKFNCVKSVAMRISLRYVCAELILCGRPLI